MTNLRFNCVIIVNFAVGFINTVLMTFKIENTDSHSKARAGTIETAHGAIETPIFMPVGTVGAVKAVNIQDLYHDINAQIILGNTYHLYLRPGLDILQQAGGLHKFNNWRKPILTDSGFCRVPTDTDHSSGVIRARNSPPAHISGDVFKVTRAFA